MFFCLLAILLVLGPCTCDCAVPSSGPTTALLAWEMPGLRSNPGNCLPFLLWLHQVMLEPVLAGHDLGHGDKKDAWSQELCVSMTSKAVLLREALLVLRPNPFREQMRQKAYRLWWDNSGCFRKTKGSGSSRTWADEHRGEMMVVGCVRTHVCVCTCVETVFVSQVVLNWQCPASTRPSEGTTGVHPHLPSMPF